MERLPVVSCQWRLAWAWFIGAGLTFLLLLTQTTSGKYGEQYTKVWSWFLPTVVPTLTLVIGALVYDAKDQPSTATIDKRMFTLSLILSIAYLFLVLGTLLSTPFSRATPVEWIGQSHLWLSPVQGLVSSALGAFFVSRRN